MTRINVGVNVRELSRAHLIAEHREITRIPNAVRSGRAVINNVPTVFTLGTGHVRFFYNKLAYLQKRYGELLDECRRRGYNVTDKTSAFDGLPRHLMNDYVPTVRDRQIVWQRIQERISNG